MNNTKNREKIINLNKDILIKDVKTIWKKILPILNDKNTKESPIKINIDKVRSFDGAGLQLLIYLIALAEEFPEKYKIHGLSEEIIKQNISFGFKNKKNEENK